MSATWEAQALCAQIDPELWFPELGGDNGTVARAICATCPVRRQCLADAMTEETGTAYSHRYGIRGGLSGRARWRLQRERDGRTTTN